MYPPTETYEKIGEFSLLPWTIPSGPYRGAIRELKELLKTRSVKVEVEQYLPPSVNPRLFYLDVFHPRLILPRVKLPSEYECVIVPRNPKTDERVFLRSRDHSTTNVGFYAHDFSIEYFDPLEVFSIVRKALTPRDLVVEELRLEKRVTDSRHLRMDERSFIPIVNLLYNEGYVSSFEGFRDGDTMIEGQEILPLSHGANGIAINASKDGKDISVGLVENSQVGSIRFKSSRKIPEVSDFLTLDKLSELFR